MLWVGAFVVFAALFLALMIAALVAGGHVVVVPPAWQPFDLASILLAASALILTAVGAIVAVASVFGYAVLRDEVTRQIRQHVENEAKAVAQRVAEETASRVAQETAVAETRDLLTVKGSTPDAGFNTPAPLTQALAGNRNDD